MEATIRKSSDIKNNSPEQRSAVDAPSPRKAINHSENEKAQALLAAVVESSEDAIISKTLEGRILSWNRAAERMFGYTAGEAIGQLITMLIPPDRQHEELTIIERLKRGERIEHYETVRVTKHGTLMDISLSISPVRDASGTIIAASKVARNITEQKRLQAERLKAEMALKEADRRKNEFLAILAHELRNPLAPIKNAIYLLEMPHAAETIKKEACSLMKRQVQQMARLIDDLMDVSRVSKGKVQLQKQPLLLNDVLRDAVEAARPLISERQHELTILQDPEPIRLHADAVRLSQIFANLLNNAAKYTNEGGHIRVMVRKHEAEAVISIEDTGIGIPSEMLSSIFDLFVQVDNSLERTHGGLGIGLTLVKKLVELHGGRVTVESEYGKGSQFTVFLPLAHETANDNTRPSPVPAGDAYRVLVVDDNLPSAKTLGWTLELLGHQVAIAHTAQEAMETAASFKPEIILLDIGLPDINGYEACRLMRQNPDTKDAFIIAQTGWGQEEHRRRSEEAGFNYHLVKPIDMHALKDLLHLVRKAPQA